MAEAVRIHTKNSADIFNFLQRNRKDFQVEKTSSGYPTFNFGNKAVYVRDKVVHRGALNKIMTFQTQVYKSDLFSYLNQFSMKALDEESEKIERTLMYKGFLFNPYEQKSFEKVIKIDCNSAYWQTCRYFKIINGEFYREVGRRCTKPTRLKITGTLGKKIILTDYVKGKKIGPPYFRKEKKRRIVFQNIYNRIRKFVDELMVWCWQQNPSNFIGYYVDCIWLKEYDVELIEKLKQIYKFKIELVDLLVHKNDHGRVILLESGDKDDQEAVPYDTQFKSNEFVSYKKLYNFTPDLGNVNSSIIMVENVNEGNVEANGSSTTEVKTEKQSNETVENSENVEMTSPKADVTDIEVPEQKEEPVKEAVTDPDEKILNDMFESGKTEVTTSELITAGFDTSRISQYEFSIGAFKLTRLLLVSPYKIEKIQ